MGGQTVFLALSMLANAHDDPPGRHYPRLPALDNAMQTHRRPCDRAVAGIFQKA